MDLTITRTIPSQFVSVFWNYPDSGAFFHGELNVGTGIPGAVTVNTTNDYVSKCANPFPTKVDVYDGRQNATSPPLLTSANVTITGC